MRPLIVAEPMLRAPSPEMTPASKRGAAGLSADLSAALALATAPSAVATARSSGVLRIA